MMNIRHISTPTGRARIDMDNDSHVAWLARRWIHGETQSSIGRSLGYAAGSRVCVAISAFIIKWSPADKTRIYFTEYVAGVGDDRKLGPLRRALENFHQRKRRDKGG